MECVFFHGKQYLKFANPGELTALFENLTDTMGKITPSLTPSVEYFYLVRAEAEGTRLILVNSRSNRFYESIIP